MAERKSNGAGARLSGVLERSGLHSPAQPLDPDEPDAPPQPVESAEGDPVDAEPTTGGRGRGGTAKKSRTVEARAAKRIKGRTIYLPDDLFERIMVQAHRRNRTISEYVASILERQVPDHRVVRAEPSEGGIA